MKDFDPGCAAFGHVRVFSLQRSRGGGRRSSGDQGATIFWRVRERSHRPLEQAAAQVVAAERD